MAASPTARLSRWSTRRARRSPRPRSGASPAACSSASPIAPRSARPRCSRLDGWLKTLGDDGKDLHAYFVSVDPERDTPDVMKTYVSNFSDRIVGITGEPDKVHAMAKAFGIYWKKVDADDGDYTMDHTASVLLLDAKGEFAGTIAYGESADTAIAKLKRLAGEADDRAERRWHDPDAAAISDRQNAKRPRASTPRSRRPSRTKACRSPSSRSTRQRDIHEVSLYVDGRRRPSRPRCGGIVDGVRRRSSRSSAKSLPDIDWVARSLEGLKPVRAGRFFVHGAHDRGKRRSGDTRHRDRGGPCLRHRPSRHHGRLPRNDRPGGAPRASAQRARPRHRQRGAGHRRGASWRIFRCWRPTSTRSRSGWRAHNVRLNRASALMSRRSPRPASTIRSSPASAPFDLIVANILARPLMRLAPEMAGTSRPAARSMLSGILDRQRDAVVAAYVGQRFRHVAHLHREGWVTIHLKR